MLARRRRLAGAAEVDATRGNLVEQRVDRAPARRRTLRVCKLAVAFERADDRRTSRAAIEPFEPQHVPEELGQAPGERVELGERVVAQRDAAR